MNDNARQLLIDLISEQGTQAIADPARCETLIREELGTSRPEAHALLAALEEHAPLELLNSRGNLPPQVLIAQLTRRLQENRLMVEEAAQWAVESWAVALGIITEPPSEPVFKEGFEDYQASTAPPDDYHPSQVLHQTIVKPLASKSCRVIAVGGGGGNAINRLIASGAGENIDSIAANTDLQALTRSRAGTKIQLGKRLTRGLAAGDPNIGRNAALESKDEIREAVAGAGLIVIAATLGGGTGTGAAPVVAALGKEQGAFVVAVATTPFPFEGKQRVIRADQGVRELLESADAVVVFPNERLLQLANRSESLADSFQIADEVLRNVADSLAIAVDDSPIRKIEVDELKSVLSGAGRIFCGTGNAAGGNRANIALKEAITSLSLQGLETSSTRNLFIAVRGSDDLTAGEVDEMLSSLAHSGLMPVKVVAGATVDNRLKDEVIVTLLATGKG